MEIVTEHMRLLIFKLSHSKLLMLGKKKGLVKNGNSGRIVSLCLIVFLQLPVSVAIKLFTYQMEYASTPVSSTPLCSLVVLSPARIPACKEAGRG